MSEQEELQTEQPQVDEVETDASSLAIDDGKGNKMVPLSALVGAKKEAREALKRIKELEPVAARVQDVETRLNQATPIIEAVLNNPKLRAEAIRVTQGTHATPGHVDQPDDDPEAIAVAEDLGLYLADGVTPDAKRAQRVLARLDGRQKRTTEEAIRPIAGIVAGSQADRNLQAALSMTDADGAPLATAESIREVAAALPPHLLANPQVMDLVINNAIGIDRRKGRTPQAPDEPLYLATAGSRRQSSPVISQDERRSLDKLGLTEKEYLETSKRLASSGGRAIVLGR